MTITKTMRRERGSRIRNPNKRSPGGEHINKTPKGVVKVSTLKKRGTKVNKRTHGRSQSRVLEFLKKNSDNSFSQRSISDSLGIREQQINRTLHRFKERGLVDNRDFVKTTKGPHIFWFITELGMKTTL